jgi:hypothetical protein
MAKHILLKCPAEKDEGDDAFAARPLCAKISDLTADASCAGRVMKMFTVDGDEATLIRRSVPLWYVLTCMHGPAPSSHIRTVSPLFPGRNEEYKGRSRIRLLQGQQGT